MQTTALQDAARTASRGLYRSLVRECRRFPDVKTRIYFIDEARAVLGGNITSRGFEAQRKALRWMQAANAGYLHAVQRCMGIAHGQRGKPRRRKVEELLREARTTEVAPLQPGNPRTRPPVYPPRLQAYLTSSHSYAKGKAPTPSQLQSPQRMPLRADPNSEEARLLGRLSPRREANIKWRYLAELRSRLVAPLDPRDIQTLGEQAQTFKLPDDMKRAEIKSLPEDLQDRFRELSRKGRKQSAWARPKRITSRFMRRRYEDLLNNAVHLDAAVTPDDKVKWSVKQSVSRRALARRFVATKEDHEWTPPT